MAEISKITIPNGTTYDIKDTVARTVMTGASPSSDGTAGLVPAPSSDDVLKFLKGNGTWEAIPVQEILNTNATGIDIDFTDMEGNVILRLANGHIITKNFDSSSFAAITTAQIDALFT